MHGVNAGRLGSFGSASRTLGRRQRRLVPLATVTVAALIFAALLVLVRLRWAPLESADHGAAAGINGLIAGNATLVAVVKAVTSLGSDGVLWVVVGAAAVVLALRRQWRLAVYLLVTGAGALILDPVLKSLVGRLRPVVAHPIAHGIGNSFPSGHSLGSIVCYGAVLLVFLPAARGRWRTTFISVIVALVALIGISRILLGVHYLSDVVGAWAVGIAWLGLTTFAFEVTRDAPPAGDRPGDPGAGARGPRRPQAGPAGARRGQVARPPPIGRVAAGLVVAWVLILGIIVGLGELVTKFGNGNVLGDHTIPHWFAANRTPGGDRWSLVFSTLGATQAILIVALTTCVVFLAVTRHWRPVLFIATVMAGELAAFLIAAAVVKRTRRSSAPRPRPADLGLPVRARGGHLLPLCRGGDSGHRPRPRLVAVAVPHPGDRHAGAGRDLPHVPGGAPPDRHPRQPPVRRPLAHRRYGPDQAQLRRPRPGGPSCPRRAAPAGGRDGRPRIRGARDGAAALSEPPRALPGQLTPTAAPGSAAH